jgi:hypothetical protein
MTISAARRFGIQPVQNIILNDGRTIAGFVRSLSVDRAHAMVAIAGRVPPSPELRDELVSRLGLPLERLFTASALAATYKPEHRPRASVTS